LRNSYRFWPMLHTRYSVWLIWMNSLSLADTYRRRQRLPTVWITTTSPEAEVIGLRQATVVGGSCVAAKNVAIRASLRSGDSRPVRGRVIGGRAAGRGGWTGP